MTDPPPSTRSPLTRRRRRPPTWVIALVAGVGLPMLTMGLFRLYVAYLGTPVRATIDHLSVTSDNDGTTYRAVYHFEIDGRTHVSKAQVSDRLRGWLHAADGSAAPGVVPARAVRLPGGHAYCLLEDGPLTWLLVLLGLGGTTAVVWMMLLP